MIKLAREALPISEHREIESDNERISNIFCVLSTA